MKAVVAAFNQEKALVGAFSVITILRMELFEALDCQLQLLPHLVSVSILASSWPASLPPRTTGPLPGTSTRQLLRWRARII